MNTYENLTPVETNYNADNDFQMRGDVTVGDSGITDLEITVAPVPLYASGRIKLYNPNDTDLFEDVKFSANDTGVLTILEADRGQNGTTPLSEITTDFKLIHMGETDDGRFEIDALFTSMLASIAGFVKLTTDQVIAGIKTFSSSPLVPTTTTLDAQAMSRKEILENIVASVGGVASLNTKTGAIVLAGGDQITITESPDGTFTFDFVPSSTVYEEITITAGEGEVDLDVSTNQYCDLIADTVMSLTGGSEGDVKRVEFNQDSTGSRILTLKIVDVDLADGDINTTDDEVTVGADINTGTRLILTGADLPDPLVADTEYFAINVDATKIQIATTFANAKAGTAIVLTDVGTGSRNIYSKPKTPSKADIVLSTDAYAVDYLIFEKDRHGDFVVSNVNSNI